MAAWDSVLNVLPAPEVVPLPPISMVLITSTSGSRSPPTPDHRARPTASAAALRVLARSELSGPVAAFPGRAAMVLASAVALAALVCPPAVWKAITANAAIVIALVANTLVIFAPVGMPPPYANYSDCALQTRPARQSFSSDALWWLHEPNLSHCKAAIPGATPWDQD